LFIALWNALPSPTQGAKSGQNRSFAEYFFAAPGRGRSGSVEFVFFRTLPFDFAHGSTLLTFPKRAEGRAVRLRRCSASLSEVEASLSNGGSWLGRAADFLGDDAARHKFFQRKRRGGVCAPVCPEGTHRGAPTTGSARASGISEKRKPVRLGQHHRYSSGC